MDKKLYETMQLVRCFRRTKSNMPKATSQKIHALRRFEERYGKPLSSKQYKDMCRLVRANKAVVLERQTNRVSKMKVNFNGVDVYFCYDHLRHTINTFLKPEWVLNPTEATTVEMNNEIKEHENE